MFSVDNELARLTKDTESSTDAKTLSGLIEFYKCFIITFGKVIKCKRAKKRWNIARFCPRLLLLFLLNFTRDSTDIVDVITISAMLNNKDGIQINCIKNQNFENKEIKQKKTVTRLYLTKDQKERSFFNR